VRARAMTTRLAVSTRMVRGVTATRMGIVARMRGDATRRQKRHLSSVATRAAIRCDDESSSPSTWMIPPPPNGSSFDVIVVGNGPIGSAVARHVATSSSFKDDDARAQPSVLVLDSDALTSGSDDLGRIVRPLDAEGRDDWTALNVASIKSFDEMERKSGLKFFTRKGSLAIGSEPFVERGASKLRARGVAHERTKGGAAIAERWGFLTRNGIPESYEAVSDEVGGFVNPHAMRAAQNALMRAANDEASVTRSTCVGVRSTEGSRCEVRTAEGNVYTCGVAVLACGAYTEPLARECGLLDESRASAFGGIKISRRTVVLAEILESEARGALASMPTIKYEVPAKILERARVRSASGTSDQSLNEAKSVYVLPPIYYPGPEPSAGWYMKIGGGPNDFFDKSNPSYVRTERELAEWMSSEGDESVADQLHDILLHAFPDVNFLSLSPKACVTTTSDDGSLQTSILGAGDDIIAVSACQGKAAGPADAIGVQVAEMVLKQLSSKSCSS